MWDGPAKCRHEMSRVCVRVRARAVGTTCPTAVVTVVPRAANVANSAFTCSPSAVPRESADTTLKSRREYRVVRASLVSYPETAQLDTHRTQL